MTEAIDQVARRGWLALLAALLVVLSPALGFWLLLSQLSLRFTGLVVQIFVAACLIYAALLGMYQLMRYTTGHDAKLGPPLFFISDLRAQLATSVGYVTVGFVSITALLLRHGVLITATGAKGAKWLTFDALETYVWNVVYAIPTRLWLDPDRPIHEHLGPAVRTRL
jgi:hypothetical protein